MKTPRKTTNLSPDTLIDLAQRERLALLIKPDIDDKLKIAILNGIAMTAVAVKKINTDTNNANADREVAAAISTVIKNITGNPFIISVDTNYRANTHQAPEVPAIVLVEDETSTALSNLDFDKIINKS